jgi:FAD/FMN-containing dehydrogenase
MNTIVRYNASVPSVTVQPGITYADLGPALCSFLILFLFSNM